MMTSGHAVNDLYQGAVPALLTFLVADRHYSYVAATGITFAATFLSSLAQPLFGVLTDRRRLGWLVPLGMATAGIGVGLCGVVDSYAWTWTMIALSGLGVAAYHPEASRSARLVSAGTAAGMSWFAVGGNIGFALGPLLSTLILAVTGLTGTPCWRYLRSSGPAWSPQPCGPATRRRAASRRPHRRLASTTGERSAG